VPPKVGILAGTGELPRRLVDACQTQNRDVFVVTFEGDNHNVGLDDVAGACVHLGQVGTVFRLLKENGCQEIAMAGHFRRPAYNKLKLDLKAARLLPKLLRAKGDDALLRILTGALEHEGFKVIGAESLLPTLQIAPGNLGAKMPSQEDQADINLGTEILRILGPYDVGQAVVVRRGRVLGVEGPEGTDSLLDRCAAFNSVAGGTLVKMRKPGQDERVDLPSIGPETVRRAAAARLAGVAIEAHATLVLDQEGVRTQANRLGLFVVGFVEATAPDRQ